MRRSCSTRSTPPSSGASRFDNVADAVGSCCRASPSTARPAARARKSASAASAPNTTSSRLNNRIIAINAQGRDVAFDVLPAEVITGADVLKSAEASAVEGSIGGTVNLHTASPFDNPGLHGGVRGERNYNDMSELLRQQVPRRISRTPTRTRTSAFPSAACTRTTTLRTDSLNAYNQFHLWAPTTYPLGRRTRLRAARGDACCITFGDLRRQEAHRARRQFSSGAETKSKVSADYL